MNIAPFHLHIVDATLTASFVVDVCAVAISPKARCLAETCLYPALLPMIPGIHAYKAFGGFVPCMLSSAEVDYDYHLYLLTDNAMTCGAILLSMVVGATISIFMIKKISFQATR